MMIVDAVETAGSKHVVYFLVSAYVETLHYYDETRSALSPQVTKLPLAGRADVTARLRVLSQMFKEEERHPPRVRLVIEEAIEIFAAASRRLGILAAQSVRPVHVPGATPAHRALPEWVPGLPHRRAVGA